MKLRHYNYNYKSSLSPTAIEENTKLFGFTDVRLFLFPPYASVRKKI